MRQFALVKNHICIHKQLIKIGKEPRVCALPLALFYFLSEIISTKFSKAVQSLSLNLHSAETSRYLKFSSPNLWISPSIAEICSSFDNSTNISPFPVRSQSPLTLNFSHISKIVLSDGFFVPVSICAIKFLERPIFEENSSCVNPNRLLNSLIL